LKKSLVALIIIIAMIVPAWNIGCSSPSPELPAIYASKSMSGMNFKYPADWEDKTSEIKQAATQEYNAMGWVDPSESVVLVLFALDNSEDTTGMNVEEKREFARLVPQLSLLGEGYGREADRDTTVGGQWAYEIEFEDGEILGGFLSSGSGSGYCLSTFNEGDLVMLLFFTKSKYKEKMLPVYEKVKESIKFEGMETTDNGVTSITQPTPVDLPTPSVLEEMEYETYSLEGVRFDYPGGWRWSKNDLIAGASAAWEDPTYSAMLFGMVTVWPELLEKEEMEEYAIEFGDDMVEAIMDKFDTMISHKEIEVAGGWALEMEINGRISGRKHVGYILSAFNQTTQFSIVFFVEETDWEEFGGIYSKVKDSIEFGGGWTKRYGGRYEDSGAAVQQVSDGGYIVTGMTASYGAGKGDVWLVKTNPRGFMEWDMTFGGAERDNGNAVQETSDGGYIIVGCTESYGSGNKDLWLIKTNSMGSKVWDNTLGGSTQDCGLSVQQTSDGGYITVGSTESFGMGTKDAWLVKFDSMGKVLWEETYGLDGSDDVRSVQQTQDGGYIITGQTSSVEEGISQMWLIKTDSGGNTQWEKTFGNGHGSAVIQLDDGGYCITGSSLLRTDSKGAVLWETSLAESGMDEGTSIQQTSDGNLISAGHIREYSGGDLVCSVWLMKLDETGEVIFATTYGGTKCDLAYSVQQTNDGGYIIAGFTETYGVSGSGDLWLIKTDAEGYAE